LNVPFPAGSAAITESDMAELYALFDNLYEQAFGQGSGYREAGKEILTFRLTATGLLKKPDIKAEVARGSDGARAVKGRRDVYFEEDRKFVATPVKSQRGIRPGCSVDQFTGKHDFLREAAIAAFYSVVMTRRPYCTDLMMPCSASGISLAALSASHSLSR
jgi:hypothetical protein